MEKINTILIGVALHQVLTYTIPIKLKTDHPKKAVRVWDNLYLSKA